MHTHQPHPAHSAEAAWHDAAETLVLRRLLLAEAGRQGIDATPEGDETAEEAQVRRLLDRELRIPEADEATCNRWFAAAHSDCPSRSRGGDLGAIEPGAIHDVVVETRYGFHVIQLRAREEGRQPPFEAVHPRIGAWLREASFRRAAHQFMALLAAKARLEGLVLSAGAAGPLVQ
jgi:peptidyl-prolyl cis-trans isomerase C